MVGNPKGGEHLEDVRGLEGNIKRTLKEYDGKGWPVLIWLRTGTSAGLL